MKVVINHDFKNTDGKEFKKGDNVELEFNEAKELIHQGLAAAVDPLQEVGKENIIAPDADVATEDVLYTNKENDKETDTKSKKK